MDTENFEMILNRLCLDLQQRRNWRRALRFVERISYLTNKLDCYLLASTILLEKLLTNYCYDFHCTYVIIKMYLSQFPDDEEDKSFQSSPTRFDIRDIRCHVFSKFGYRFFPFCDKPEFVTDLALEIAMDYVDEKLLSAVVKYARPTSYRFERAALHLFRKFCNFLRQNGIVKNFGIDSTLSLVYRYLRPSRYLRKLIEEEESRVCRFYLITRILQAVIFDMTGDPRLQRYMLCIRLFLRTTTAPFVSQDEIRSLLVDTIENESYKDAMAIVAVRYANLFKVECAEANRPRRLKQLCRCIVRESCYKPDKVLPELVNGLNIPPILKEYVLGGPIIV